MRSTHIGQMNMDELLEKLKLDKKKIIIAGAAFFVFVFFSLVATCVTSSSSSSDNDPVLIKPDQTKVKGDLKDCFEVIDKSYEVKFDRGEKIITIEVKRTDAELPYDREDFDVYENKGDNKKSKVAGFGIELLDSAGNVIDQIAPNETCLYKEAMAAALRLLPGETGTVKWGTYDNWNWKIASFRILSSVEANTKEKGDILDQAFDKLSEEDENEDSKKDKKEKKSDLDEDIEDAKEALEVTKDIIEVEKKLLDALY